jgi:hypothetical protein
MISGKESISTFVKAIQRKNLVQDQIYFQDRLEGFFLWLVFFGFNVNRFKFHDAWSTQIKVQKYWIKNGSYFLSQKAN